MDFSHSQAVATEAGRARAAATNAAAAKIRPVTRDEAATGVRGVARTVLRTSVRSCAGALRCSRSGSHLGDYLSAMCSNTASTYRI